MDRDELTNAPSGLDHLLYGARDLDAGVREIERLLGVRATAGGRHRDYGTRNAVAALGASTYLEVIAPDPELPEPARGRLFRLEALERPRLVTWVLREEAIEERVERARAAGLDLGELLSGSRERPDGTVLTWKVTDPYATRMGGAVPFLISWGDTPHPAASAPAAGALAGLRILHPDPGGVRVALRALGVEVAVEQGPRVEIVARIRVGAGTVEIR